MSNTNKNSPLTKVSDTEYIEGYWASKDPTTVHPSELDSLYDKYPWPVDSGQPVDLKFLEKYKAVLSENFVNMTGYFGYSKCRFCHKSNGSHEHTLVNKNGVKFICPQGLLHYYTEHRVQPSDEFRKFIEEY
jgi:hypothetical protein